MAAPSTADPSDGQVTGTAHFRALTGPAAPETAEAQIRRYIVEHGLRPGDRLPSEAELTAATGSSRVTVREALRSLEALGVVESRAGSGWYVRAFDVSVAVRTFAHSLAFHPAALLDLLTVRTSVEGDLIAGVAGRLSPSDLAALDELVDRMRWRAARGEAFPAEDSEFHRRLLAASGNLVALALVDLYFKVMDALYEQGFPHPEPGDLSEVAQAHVGILQAVRSGDAALVRAQLSAAHHREAHRRLGAWLAAQRGVPGGAEAAEVGTIEAALQAALLWPGPGAR